MRGMHVTYPTPEPLVTPRAREGLRAVVPTIFPPSTVNRGENIHFQAPERNIRENWHSVLQQTSLDGLIHIPKKRGPKPKLRFEDSNCSPVIFESRPEEQSHGHYKLDKLNGDKEMRLVKLSHRHPNNHGHSHKHHHPHYYHHHAYSRGLSHGGSYKQLYSERSLHAHRADMNTHRTKYGPGYLAPTHFNHSKMSHSLSCHAELSQMEKPYFLDRPSPARFDDDLDEVIWRPSLCNMEKVLVTDVTTNFLTVTIKESSTSKGFFTDKR